MSQDQDRPERGRHEQRHREQDFRRLAAGVLGRLILVSILVGVVLSALGLDPFDIVRSIERLFRTIWNMGFDAFRWVWRYFLLGRGAGDPDLDPHAARQRAARQVS